MAEASFTGQPTPAPSVPEAISGTNNPSGFEPVQQKMKWPRTVVLKKGVLYCLYRSEGKLPSSHDTQVLRKWIEAISKELKVNLRSTQSMMHRVWKHTSRVVYEFKKLRHGRQQLEYLDKEWKIELQATDVKNSKDLALEERSCAVEEENTKLQKENSELKKSEQKLKQQVSNLSNQVRKAMASGYQPSRRGRGPNKSPSKCTLRHQRNLKRKREEDCSNSLAWLEAEGYTATKVVLKCNKTGKTETVTLDASDLLGPDESSITSDQLDTLNMMLYIKDKYNVSGGAYHEMAQLCKTMPRHYRLKDRVAELNKLWNIHPTPPGTSGVQQSLEERLKTCLQHLISVSPPDAKFLTEKNVRVKLTGDGTNIGKRLHVVNFGFTLLDEGDKAYSAAGNHCLAIFKEPESYDSMKRCLSDIIEEVNTLSSVDVNGTTFTIDYYLGGDWKFLAMATDIDSASSTHACIWCKCPALERHNSTQKWSMIDPEHGARTVDENIRLAQSRSRQRYVSHPPLFPNIPLTHIVVDNLHMFLRVADVLIDLLIGALRRLDNIDKTTKVQNLDRLTHLGTFQRCVQHMGISGYAFWIGRESRRLKWRTLTGPEKLILFKNIDIPEMFPEIENGAVIQDLWKDLLHINQLFSARPEDIALQHIREFETRSKAFVDKFVQLYPTKFVTPYMHCMMMHVSEFMMLHGAILPFTQQGLEKYNDLMTKDYFRSTSHRGEQCLVQILQKQNRIEHLKGMGAQRSKRHKITCSNCHLQGHNKWTCQAACSNCGEMPFQSHLLTIGSRKVPRCLSENTEP